MGIAHSRCPRTTRSRLPRVWFCASCLLDEQRGILAVRNGRASRRHRPFALSCGPVLVDLKCQVPRRRFHQV
eukprot:7894705-Pyramimonas_sp.AAC.1